MATPRGASYRGSDDALQNTQTEQDILNRIKGLLRQKVELDIRNAARSLGKYEVDAPSVMSDQLVQRELSSLERHVTGFIRICEDPPFQRSDWPQVYGTNILLYCCETRTFKC